MHDSTINSRTIKTYNIAEIKMSKKPYRMLGLPLLTDAKCIVCLQPLLNIDRETVNTGS